MNNDQGKRQPGRPKTLERSHVLDIAMTSYWQDGVNSVSLNEFCRRAGISKPALYREFGSEDGLKAAALEHYYKNVLEQFHMIFSGKIRYDQVLDLVISTTIDSDLNPQHPASCLFVVMSNAQAHLGTCAQARIKDLKTKILKIYADWFERSKKSGEFVHDISSRRAAFYLHAQISNAMNQKAQGEPNASIGDVLSLALSPLRQHPPK